MRIRAEDVVATSAQADKLCEVLAIASAHHGNKFRSQHKRRFLSFVHLEKALEIAKKVTEIDVKQEAALGQHDVVVVSIADAQHVGRYTVARARTSKVVYGLRVVAL